MGNHKGALQRALSYVVQPPDLPVECAHEGQSFGPVVAYRTPGHTPGHTAFVSADLGVAFLGDLVRADDGDLRPSGWALGYDATEVSESIRSLSRRTPDFEVAAVGYGDPLSEGGAEALAALADSVG